MSQAKWWMVPAPKRHVPGSSVLAWEDLAALPLRQHTPPVDTVVAWRPDEDFPVLRRFLRVALATPEPDVLGPDHARGEAGG